MGGVPFEFAEENVPLAPLTLYKVGGPARLGLFPRTTEEACAAYQWLCSQPGPRLILGGGSNVLISDAGFLGAVLITTCLDKIESVGQDRYQVESGTRLERLVREVMLPNNYAGVGGLTGIPGSVGGAIYMNAGTVKGTTCELLESVELIGPTGRRVVAMAPALYGYRGQKFCTPGTLILRGIFHFEKAKEDQRAVYDHYMLRRQQTQPQGACCGSVFKNPPGDHAGRLIEACGLKGTRHGGAVISPAHANFIMNEDNATFGDILFLVQLCKQRVKQEFHIDLEEEVVIIR